MRSRTEGERETRKKQGERERLGQGAEHTDREKKDRQQARETEKKRKGCKSVQRWRRKKRWAAGWRWRKRKRSEEQDKRIQEAAGWMGGYSEKR